MPNKVNISPRGQEIIVYIVLTIMTLAVYWQVNHFGFIIEDNPYFIGDSRVQVGITTEGIRWAFSTTHYYLWQPLLWLSFMFDYQLYGLNAGGYHITNLVLHILSTLLLFWAFNRMTKEVWKSAFVAAFFSLHPLHVESVAWISERKDVLSAFFWMLTICLYIYYTEKSSIRSYLLVLFSFVVALMSKPMVVTLPFVLILLDYWPLKRLTSYKSGLILRQLQEKTPFFILSIIISIVTLYAQKYNLSETHTSLVSRLAKAAFAFVTYLEKIFWPHDLALCHPSFIPIPVCQTWCNVLFIIFISATIVILIKRMPSLFVGWLWYSITLLPVIGIVHSDYIPFMFDHFTYLPSIGISIMLAWGIPILYTDKSLRKKILLPMAMVILFVLVTLAWRQCSYWKNDITLLNHTLQITNDNTAAYNNLGITYDAMGQHLLAVNYYHEAIRTRPDHAKYYHNRGTAYANLGQYKKALEDYNKAIHLNQRLYSETHNADTYNNRGFVYIMQGHTEAGCRDLHKACDLGSCKALEWAKNRKTCR